MSGTLHNYQEKIYLQRNYLESSDTLTMNNSCIILALWIIHIVKLKRTKSVGCTEFYFINNVLLLSVLQLYYQSEIDIQGRDYKRLKNCSKATFFSIESLKLSYDISNFSQKRYFYLLEISKMKFKNELYFVF